MGPHICIFPNQSLRSWLWKMQIYGPTFYRSLAQEEIVIMRCWCKGAKSVQFNPVTSPTLHRGMSCFVSCSPVLRPLYLRAMEFPAGGVRGRAINSHLPKHGVTRCLLGKIAHSHPKAPRQPWRHLPRRDLYAWQQHRHQFRSPSTYICGNISQ